MTIAIALPGCQRLSALSYRVKNRLKHLARAWRYATGRMTKEDASWIAYECDVHAGCFPLVSIDVDGVMDLALDKWEDNPKLEDFARDAVCRVWNKWSSSGDEQSAAIDWAMDLIAEYAKEDGVELVERV